LDSETHHLFIQVLDLLRKSQLKAEEAARAQAALLHALEHVLPGVDSAYKRQYALLEGAFSGPRSTAEVDRLLDWLQRTN
jgi:hypothetical protein